VGRWLQPGLAARLGARRAGPGDGRRGRAGPAGRAGRGRLSPYAIATVSVRLTSVPTTVTPMLMASVRMTTPPEKIIW